MREQKATQGSTPENQKKGHNGSGEWGAFLKWG